MKIFLFLFVSFFIGSEAGLFGSSQHKNHSSSSNSQSSGLGLNPVGLIEDGIHKSAQGIGKPFTSVKDFAGSVLPKELTPEGLIEAWTKYKRDFKKSYSIQEEIPRRASFIKSYTDIVLHNLNFNKGFQTFKVGLNAFADASAAELKKLTSGVKLTPEILDRLKPSEKDLEEDAKYYGSLPQAGGLPTLRRKRAVSEPDAIDWREKGTVGPVKNQGFCGSCYAFSSLAALESLYKRTNHKYVPLSEQQLVDCSKSFGNEGCDGGLQENVYKFIQQHGAVKNETYRYTEEEGECKSNVELVTKVKGLVRVPKTEAALKKAVGLIGPVAISMDVGEPNFLHYSEGIYRTTNCSNTDLNHGMAVVGYGSDGPGKDFWIIRNSWGESWGLKGYMKLARNAKNMCGVATYAIYPKLK